MVIESIEDIRLDEFSYSKNIQTALRYIKEHDLLGLPAGKIVIDGDNVYANRSSYIGKEKEACKIEGHDKYLDLQLVIKGVESFGYVDKRRETLTVSEPYNEVKDKTNYVGPLDGVVTLHSGFFALVFPNDLHAPCIKYNDEIIEKIVFKIKIDF